MGIRQFFGWFKRMFAGSIYHLKAGESIRANNNNYNTDTDADIDMKIEPERAEESIGVLENGIDNLLLDMNGIFHNSAQKIYKYGNHKPLQSFFNKNSFNKIVF